MKAKTLGLCVALLVSVFALEASAEPQARRYALIVANNASVDEGVEPLRYADDDGARFFELFESYADSATLLTTLDKDSQEIFPRLSGLSKSPTAENLKNEVSMLARRIAADHKAGIRSEVYLVFTGHGNVDDSGEGYLSLVDAKLKRSDLYRDVIRPLKADYTHVIIDACHAYFMVNARGGHWRDDRSGVTLDSELEAYLRSQANTGNQMATIGVILSTAGAAEVHEWSRYRAGVFSHQLRSGLLGAADADGDGDVTYPEIEAYLAAANASVTNPRAKIRVHVSAPKQDLHKPLTKIGGFVNATVLTYEGGARMHVEDPRGLRYADLHAGAGVKGRLVLLKNPVPGLPYYLRTGDQQAEIDTRAGQAQMGALAFVERPNQARGSVEESFRTDLFSTPFGPAFVAGYTAGRDQQTSVVGAVSTQPDDVWVYELALDYSLSTPPIALDGVQHQFGVGFQFRHESGWGVGPFAEYGFSGLTEASVHRIALGVETSLASPLYTTALSFGIRGRLGMQSVLFSSDNDVSSDPIGLRASAAALLGWTVSPQVQADLVGGLAIDVVTRAGLEANKEEVVLSPFGGLGLRF